MHNDLEYWVWLSSIPGIGAIKSKKLLEYFEEPYNIFTAKEKDFATLSFLSHGDVCNLINKENKEKLKRNIENINANDIKIITINDENYPEYLKNI